MKYLLELGLCFLIIQQSVAPPVTKEEKDDKPEEEEYATKDVNFEDQLEYGRYLQEVVEVLEDDPEFKEKLRKANESDIKSGKIAHELDFVNHNVRSKLDEIKRREIERLRHLAIKEMELENGVDREHMKVPEHLNHKNPHYFEIEDLKKLIAKTTEDINEADRKRREQFKEHEMQKKFEEEQKIKGLNEEARKKYEEDLHDLHEKQKKHDPLHHPGSKQQLEEVWEKQDHMEGADFDPASFFQMHDLDSNGVWDQNEVKALFRKELDKLYAEKRPGVDLLERAEEMERMREHVFKEADLNKDGLLSFHEFMEQTNKPDFKRDEGWETLDEQQIYSPQEYEEFEKRRQEEIQRMIAQGMLPPHTDINGHPQQFPPQGQYGHHPQGMPNQQVPYHGQPVQQPQYQQHPPQYQGQVPPQQYHGQVPQQVAQQVPGQQGYVPQQAVPLHQNQPQHQYQGQVPQQHYQGQPPQQQYHGQPPHQQQYQGQVPQQQGQAPQPQQGQVPQQQQAVPAQGNPPVAQVTGNIPVANSIPEVNKV